jgi:hypothetical protein
MAQVLLASLLVTACALYAAWVLMPAAARRWFVRGLLAGPLPPAVARALAPYATAPTGCACDGCDRAAPDPSATKAAPIPGQPAPITFFPRRKG